MEDGQTWLTEDAPTASISVQALPSWESLTVQPGLFSLRVCPSLTPTLTSFSVNRIGTFLILTQVASSSRHWIFKGFLFWYNSNSQKGCKNSSKNYQRTFTQIPQVLTYIAFPLSLLQFCLPSLSHTLRHTHTHTHTQLKSKLQRWCLFTSKYFSVDSLNARALSAWSPEQVSPWKSAPGACIPNLNSTCY